MLALIAAFAILLCACGRNAKSLQTPALSSSAPADSAEVISQVLAAQAPEGVDAELWDMLKNELARELETKSARLVKELTISWIPRTDGVQWGNEFMSVDGSDNGIVDLEDITPIALNYGSDVNYCDYNHDGIVDVKDITPIARNYGLSCSGFIVEYSSTSANEGFSVAANVDYAEYITKSNQHRLFAAVCYPWEQPNLWVRIRTLDKDGIEIGSNVHEIGVGGASPPPHRSPNLSVSSTVPPKIIWDNAGLLADGNQDGATDWFDAGFITEYYQGNTTEHPEYEVFDYNSDGQINISDMIPVAMTYHYAIARFVIELSTTSADEGFAFHGERNYTDSTDINSGGFRYYEYEITSPPVGIPYWVRIVPIGRDDTLGLPSTSVQFGGE